MICLAFVFCGQRKYAGTWRSDKLTVLLWSDAVVHFLPFLLFEKKAGEASLDKTYCSLSSLDLWGLAKEQSGTKEQVLLSPPSTGKVACAWCIFSCATVSRDRRVLWRRKIIQRFLDHCTIVGTLHMLQSMEDCKRKLFIPFAGMKKPRGQSLRVAANFSISTIISQIISDLHTTLMVRTVQTAVIDKVYSD